MFFVNFRFIVNLSKYGTIRWYEGNNQLLPQTTTLQKNSKFRILKLLFANGVEIWVTHVFCLPDWLIAWVNCDRWSSDVEFWQSSEFVSVFPPSNSRPLSLRCVTPTLRKTQLFTVLCIFILHPLIFHLITFFIFRLFFKVDDFLFSRKNGIGRRQEPSDFSVRGREK